MKVRITLLKNIVFAVVFCLCIAPAHILTSQTMPTYYVIGIKNSVRDKEWKELGIGFGVNNLVTQAVFYTNEFIPLEEKKEITDQIKKAQAFYWQFSGEMTEENIRSLMEESPQADIVFYGEILSCRTTRTKAFAGFASTYKRTVTVVMKLSMLDTQTGSVLASEGKGTSQKGGTAMVFEAKKNGIDFSSTMVGIAVEQAVNDAVDNLMEQYNKR